MSDDSKIHLAERGKDNAPCGASVFSSSWSMLTEAVTCVPCLAEKPAAAPAAPGTPERREQMIEECGHIEACALAAIESLRETARRAEALKHRLMRLSAAEAAQNGPAAWLGTLKGYATAQRVSAAAAGLNKPAPY